MCLTLLDSLVFALLRAVLVVKAESGPSAAVVLSSIFPMLFSLVGCFLPKYILCSFHCVVTI